MPVINRIISTCKLIADVVPRVLSVGLAGWGTVLTQVLFHVPAFGFIKGVEEQRKLLDFWLMIPQDARLTDHQWTDQT